MLLPANAGDFTMHHLKNQTMTLTVGFVQAPTATCCNKHHVWRTAPRSVTAKYIGGSNMLMWV